MGKKAALMAIEEIDAPSDQKPSPQHLVFEATLVERESSLIVKNGSKNGDCLLRQSPFLLCHTAISVSVRLAACCFKLF